MEIIVDHDRCEGHGVCEEAAPELFRLDDDGVPVLLFEGPAVPAGQHGPAAAAVRTCPVGALATRE
ncbi:ferredoxin [Thermomonospora umbrina]|uniref:Ferredoxin n=1 Tax=Thermomonospora umbrina TaxID=111806 RepID=A0A3D9SYM5_9ACTN|nr:ferredoxin [Thermomonospora umbrina]REF00949.1 ferredoxin [Thermomonospora umbrina]